MYIHELLCLLLCCVALLLRVSGHIHVYSILGLGSSVCILLGGEYTIHKEEVHLVGEEEERIGCV